MLSFTSSAAAAEEPDPPAQLQPLWVPQKGARSVGGCDDDLDNMKKSYTESIEFAKGAILALQTLQQPLDPTTIDEAAFLKWDRRARLAKAFFQIDAEPDEGNQKASEDRADFAISK